MAGISNYAAVATARNATTTHTVSADGTGGTVVSGTGFTPTSGRLLLCSVEGAVTSSTPTGWTLPTNGSAINGTGLYVWWRSASATSADQVVTTHNDSNYPVMFHFLEFLATSTFVSAATAINVASGSAGPTLSGLTGSNWLAASLGAGMGTTQGATSSTVWSTGTEQVDTSTPNASGTDGYLYSLSFTADYASATYSSTATMTFAGSAVAAERLVFAVNAAGGAAVNPLPEMAMAPIRR